MFAFRALALVGILLSMLGNSYAQDLSREKSLENDKKVSREDAAHRDKLVDDLTREYRRKHNIGPQIIATPAPADWINARLKELGERWTYQPSGGSADVRDSLFVGPRGGFFLNNQDSARIQGNIFVAPETAFNIKQSKDIAVTGNLIENSQLTRFDVAIRRLSVPNGSLPCLPNQMLVIVLLTIRNAGQLPSAIGGWAASLETESGVIRGKTTALEPGGAISYRDGMVVRPENTVYGLAKREIAVGSTVEGYYLAGFPSHELERLRNGALFRLTFRDDMGWSHEVTKQLPPLR